MIPVIKTQMKNTVLIFAVFISLFCFSLSLADSIPEIKDCDSIVLRTSQGWWLNINKDGSGSYGFGTMIDRIEVKPTTFDFERVYEKAIKDSLEQRKNAEGSYVAVSYYSSGQSSAQEYYLVNDIEWSTKLFFTAINNIVLPSDEIEERWHNKINDLWKKNPLVTPSANLKE